MSKEAMKLALEALALKFSEGWHEGIKIDASDIMLLNHAAQALEKQPAQQEPVAYLCENAVGHKYFRWKKPSSTYKPIALYTSPPAQPALDKKAENARELGLDYEPVCNKDPQGCWNVRCQLGKKCKNTPAHRPWVGLTDEQIDAEFDAFASNFDHESNEWLDMGVDAYFRAGFKAAHGIKENT